MRSSSSCIERHVQRYVHILANYLDLVLSYLQEADALEDTAASVRGTPREPSLQKIHPVGHITLDVDNTEASHLGLDLPDAGVYWIKTFYVSRVLQSKGVGRAAMDSIESIAVTEPICARTLALDTVHKDDQLPVNSNGQEPRKVCQDKPALYRIVETNHPQMTNQEWYSRRGYQLIKTVPNFYLNSPAPDGSVRESRTVFMKRNVV